MTTWQAAHHGAPLRPDPPRCDRCKRVAVARVNGERLCKPHHERVLRKMFEKEA